jgi:excisionase family DNA binding protein
MLCEVNTQQASEGVMAVATHEEWLTVEDVAKKLKYSKETVRRLLRSGELRGMQLSKRAGWRMRAQDVEDFIAKQYQAREHQRGE